MSVLLGSNHLRLDVLTHESSHTSRVNLSTLPPAYVNDSLKLGNFFLNDKMELKIGDFGLATRLEFDGEKKR
jgi:serine/threonine protein kinase